MGAGYYDMPVNDMAMAGGGINWVLICVIAGSFILGVVLGIVLGKKAMKKRDI